MDLDDIDFNVNNNHFRTVLGHPITFWSSCHIITIRFIYFRPVKNISKKATR